MTPSFFEEMQKISVKLNDDERAKQTAQFAMLGAVSAPVISAGKNLTTYGQISPWTASKRRWLLGTAGAGAVAAGVVPSIRHGLERNMQAKAKTRLREQRLARQ
jgi:hypothetical protein